MKRNDNRNARTVLPEIEVMVGDYGEAEIKVGDGCGKGCVDLTADLEAALGGAQDREFTEGYHKQPRHEQGQHGRQGQR